MSRATLNERDQAILSDLHRVRLLTGAQLDRLHFATVAPGNARSSARRRSLGRLNKYGFVTTLPRRIGGERAGAAGAVYTLDRDGQRLFTEGRRPRRPWPIGWQFTRHSLDVAELYVRLRECERCGGCRLRRYDAEPGSWLEIAGHRLKPDAYAVYDDAEWECHDWIEVDRSTESLPALRRKLLIYVHVALTGDSDGLPLIPKVLVTVPSNERRAAVQELIDRLPEPAAQLIRVELFGNCYRPPPDPSSAVAT